MPTRLRGIVSVELTEPTAEQPQVAGRVLNKAEVAAVREELPACTGEGICHLLGDKRRAEILRAADDQRILK